MRHLIDLFTGLLVGRTDTCGGTTILLNVIVTIFTATSNLLTEDAFAVVKVRSSSSYAVCVGPGLMADMARPLVDDGSTAGVKNLLGNILESAVDREAASTDVACRLMLVYMHPGVFAAH